ncbi:hypothetical protein [Candidatus Uabimicrobium amorphum]|uniref:Uncharacterized protein n=1 Tax=Uabimicrobium amorphum TaxID=2596890 RepID=A0A5S9IRW4_UABAM|nr:hypothetical protein [Candidatus Uabimicrobium amorphum]BBM87018.1 hypothetical protein UABAM_05420 [Candidatus Uabimicrobium amorphum]
MAYDASGKKVVWALAIGLLIMMPVVFINITDREQQQQADAKIHGLIEEQYIIVRKEIDTYIEKQEYELAVERWKKFLKKFSYRNQYKKQIVAEIKELQRKIK